MNHLTTFAIGIAFGYLASVIVAVLLTARGEFPHDPRFDDIDGEGEGRRP